MLIDGDNVLPGDFSCKGLLRASSESNPDDIEARCLAHEKKHADCMQDLADLPPQIINDPKMQMKSFDMLHKIGEDALAFFTKQLNTRMVDNARSLKLTNQYLRGWTKGNQLYE